MVKYVTGSQEVQPFGVVKETMNERLPPGVETTALVQYDYNRDRKLASVVEIVRLLVTRIVCDTTLFLVI